MTVKKHVLWGVVCLWGAAACAGVLLDPERNAVRVVDYPPDMPCDLTRLAKIDRAFGWNRVMYDNATNTCTVTGDLIVGANDGSETVLKVGSAERPNETLIMKGDLYVHPYFIDGENKGLYWKAPKCVNAVVLGDKDNKTISATLKFACSPTEKYTFYGGRLPWINKGQYGGGLYVYNSVVAPVNPAVGYEIGDAKMGQFYLAGAVFDNAKISGVKNMLYGLGPGIGRDYLLKNTVFERIGAPLVNDAQKASGCSFVDCGTAVLDYGCLNAELTDCVFKNNERNWSLTFSDKGLVCVDCEGDTPRKENAYSEWTDKTGKKRSPKFSNRRHLIAEVRDAAGKPVVGATVTVRPEQDGSDVIANREYPTDKDGKTPGKGQENAILLTEYVKTATAVPNKPSVQTFTYIVTAEKDGKKAELGGVVPDRSWKNVVLTLP